jgi:hypothetical protein
MSFLLLSRPEWARVKQIVAVLERFDDLTLEASKPKPQLTSSLSLYYELLDYLQEITEQEGDNLFIRDDIAQAVGAGLQKHQKYYAFMDEQNTYYVAALLDPRVKCKLMQQKLDHEGYEALLPQIRSYLHEEYPIVEPALPLASLLNCHNKGRPFRNKMFETFQEEIANISDIDRYLDSPVVKVDWHRTTRMTGFLAGGNRMQKNIRVCQGLPEISLLYL